jgi:phosphoenolpyruvate synthase/pyruvate phosphate dikinase
MATQASNNNRAGVGRSGSGSSTGGMGNLDGAKSSSTVALIAAATVIVSLLITVPVMLDMYLDIHKTKAIVEERLKKLDKKKVKDDDNERTDEPD